MEVIKKDGSREVMKFDKVSARIKRMTYGLNSSFVDYSEVAIKAIGGLYNGVTTKEVDRLVSETAASLTSIHPDYSTLAARIAVSSLHKEVEDHFSKAMEKLHKFKDETTGEDSGFLSEETWGVIKKHAKKLDSLIVEDRDFNFDYFGFKTLERSYLLKTNNRIAETPQFMYMRVSVGIWGDDLEMVQKTYDYLSLGYFTHATPTLFNAGTKRAQLASCFLLGNKGDSIEGLFDTVKDVATISKWAGGIGLHVHDVRAKGSYIKGTGGYSDGLVPMMKTYNEVARWINQGGKRKGSFAIYIEPWHADIYEFIELRKNHGKEEMRARDLFLALWTPDLFMQRVKEDGDWTLFCPNEAPGLADVYDSIEEKRFTELYTKYEKENKAKKTVKARHLWSEILKAQMETGTPYILYKDAANNKSNQKNLGTIKSSNLCAEIIEYSSGKEQAVCNLASIALPKYIEKTKDKKKFFNFEKLKEVVHQVTLNLNKVIDVNFYPTEETRVSNLKHRPIGIGVQGLADTFAILGYSFDSEEARRLNKDIFETMYYASMNASIEIAKEEGAYASFKGSPLSKGAFQFDLWGTAPSNRYDWIKLREQVVKHGARNSLLIAPMPTASTAQILGNNECFEPFTSNLYKRNTLSGEFVIVNKHLVTDLIALNLWNDHVRLRMFEENGSIQHIVDIPENIRNIYKTVWEIPQKVIIDLAAERGAFVCQSQSMNIFMKDVNMGKLNSAHFYAWGKGLKTGMYYLRTLGKSEAIKTLGVESSKSKEDASLMSCSVSDPENCQSCSG